MSQLEKIHIDVIERLKKNDHDAFEIIYNTYVDRLYFFTLKLVKTPEMAEELTQEVFIKIWSLRSSLNTELSFEAFLFRITRNMAINYLKKNAFQNKVKDHLKSVSTSYFNSTDSTIAYRETLGHLESLLCKLPPKRQQVYRMSRIEGLDHEAIANQLKISKNTVKVHMVKASKFVKEGMSKIADFRFG